MSTALSLPVEDAAGLDVSKYSEAQTAHPLQMENVTVDHAWSCSATGHQWALALGLGLSWDFPTGNFPKRTSYLLSQPGCWNNKQTSGTDLLYQLLESLRQEDFKFKACLDYRVSSRPALAT